MTEQMSAATPRAAVGAGRLTLVVGLVFSAWLLLAVSRGCVDSTYDGDEPHHDPGIALRVCADEVGQLQWGTGLASLDRCTESKREAFEQAHAAWEATAQDQLNLAYVLQWCLACVVFAAISFGVSRVARWVVAGFVGR